MKLPNKESIKKSAQDALSDVLPENVKENLVENAKEQIKEQLQEQVVDKAKNSLMGMIPDAVKSPVEKLVAASQKAQDIELEVDKGDDKDDSKAVNSQINSQANSQTNQQPAQIADEQPPSSQELQPDQETSQEDSHETVEQTQQNPSSPVAPPTSTPTTSAPPPPPTNDEPPEPEDDEPESPPQPQEPLSLKLALFGGAGIGLLFGVIMGMSVTPTVATVLGALTAMLAGILGLNDGNFSNAKAVRIGGFGFACVAGAFLGLYVRAHNAMAPTMLDMKQEYIGVGFSEEQALAFIAQKTMGATLGPAQEEPAQVEAVQAESTDDASGGEQVQQVAAQASQPATTQVAAVQFNNPDLAKAHSSLLFSADVDISSCEEMENTDDTLPLDEVLNNFELTGGMWEVGYYWASENIPEEQQKVTMLAAKDAICHREKIEQDVCKNISALDTSLNGEQITAEFATHASWQAMNDYVTKLELNNEQQTQSLLLIKNIICGEL